MSDYTKITDFAAKDSLPVGNSAKIIKGSDFDAEFESIETHIATKANAATTQTLDATLTALAGLNATAGLVEQTGADAFTKRTIGTSSGNIPAIGTTSATEALAGLLPIADQSEAEAGLVDNVAMTPLKTAQAITSQKSIVRTVQTATGAETSFTFGSIPASINNILVVVNNLSTNGTSNICFRLGTGGVAAVTGYGCVVSAMSNGVSPAVGSNDTGLVLAAAVSAGNDRNGIAKFVRITGNTWIMSYQGVETASTAVQHSGAHITLGGALDSVFLTTVGGVNVFDAGSVNILY